MAGTRLSIQTMVIVYLFVIVWVAVHNGLCRSTCKKGNLTKDLPLVPGIAGVIGNGRVQAQWWEDVVCHPFQVLLAGGSAAFSGSNVESSARNQDVIGQSDSLSNDSNSARLSSVQLSMTLAIENATQVPLWIDRISDGLYPDDFKEKEEFLAFSTLLSSNPMGLEILPPLSLEKDDPEHFWSHYKNYSTQGLSSVKPSSQHLVVYIPSSLTDSKRESIEWLVFDTNTGTTLMLPSSSSETGRSSTGQLQPLVEDWMARTIAAQQQQLHKDTMKTNDGSITTTRLTREFPIEHFLAITMPLLFPLLLPFLVSWIKEYKRYKSLIASKKEKLSETSDEAAMEPESSSSTKTKVQ